MAEENRNLEETSTQACAKGKCCCKLFCLKGLATIWKVLSILTLVYMLVALGLVWYQAGQEGYNVWEKTFFMFQYFVVYGLISLLFITISRILKTLRKIKHAVEHR